MELDRASSSGPVPSSSRPSKASGLDLYRNVLGSPKYVVAPMVDQSELAWRILSRLYGVQLCYTPMIHARLFADPAHAKARWQHFDFENGEEGDAVLDRPLVAQFCANDPEVLLDAVRLFEGRDRVDAVDLNCGCPQGIAQKGKYGAFLMEDWPLIGRIISRIDSESSIPITAKFRCYPSADDTVSYASNFLSSGAQLLTLHGRTRAQKGQLTGLADWTKIAAVKKLIAGKEDVKGKGKAPVALFANGNVLVSEDVERCLEATGADGVMSAEGNLYNPAIFMPLNRSGADAYRQRLPSSLRDALDALEPDFPRPPSFDPRTAELDTAFPIAAKVALQYLVICRTIKTSTASSAIKGHLYKLYRPIFAAGKHLDMRDRLQRTGVVESPPGKEISNSERVEPYWQLALEVKARLEADVASGTLDHFAFSVPSPIPSGVPLPGIPYSRAQPYFRPIPPSLANRPPGVDVADVQAAGEAVVVSDGEPLAKRVKLDTPAAIDGSLSVGLMPRCVGGCGNAASAKCPRGSCKTCCASLPASASEDDAGHGKACETHQARLEMERKRREDQAEKKRTKKEAAKARAAEEEARRMHKKAGGHPAQARQVTVDA